MKNKAILRAGNIIPTIGTKIEGKKAAVIIISYFKNIRLVFTSINTIA
jgi:hypothetical protein